MALAAIGTGLKVIGGLKSLFGGGNSSTDAYNQTLAQHRAGYKAAMEKGLHPIAAAGSPAGYSPVPSAAAEGALQAGQAILDHKQGKADSKLDAKQGEFLDAQIAEARSRTVLNQANARRAMSGPQPGLGQASNPVQEAYDRLSNNGARSISREPERDQPATQTVSLGKGKTGRGPNPEAFEVGLSELIAGGLIYGPQWLAQELKRRTKDAKPAGVSRSNSKGRYGPKQRY